jgi:hypothetical protein
MKMFPKTLSLLALVFATSLVPVAAQAEGENVGDTQRCIYLPRIDSSPVIDDSTILVEMKARGQYKRIDMRSPCSGLEFSGFAVGLRDDRLCTSDTVTVRREGANTCTIAQIVTIDEAEAIALRAK